MELDYPFISLGPSIRWFALGVLFAISAVGIGVVYQVVLPPAGIILKQLQSIFAAGWAYPPVSCGL